MKTVPSEAELMGMLNRCEYGNLLRLFRYMPHTRQGAIREEWLRVKLEVLLEERDKLERAVKKGGQR